MNKINLNIHFRNGVPRWTVCYCGMQMSFTNRKTCSVCGYTIEDKCHSCGGKIKKGQTWCQHCGANDEDE